MKFFRKYKKAIAAFTLVSIINQILIPGIAMGNNGGDLSAEYSKGGGVGNDLVNMYNGAFNYKVDLLTVPGAGTSFPLSISYNSSDVNMLSVPTSIGDGWSLNIPKITRQVNAVPDDHKGDVINYKYDMKPYIEMMIDVSDKNAGETAGLPINFKKLKELADVKQDWKAIVRVGWDNYSGVRYNLGVKYKSPGIAVFKDVKAQASASVVLDSKYGLTVNPSFDLVRTGDAWNNIFSKIFLSNGAALGGLGLNGSVRSGFQGYTLSTGSMFQFSYVNSGVPLVNMPMETKTYSASAKLGLGSQQKFPYLEIF